MIIIFPIKMSFSDGDLTRAKFAKQDSPCWYGSSNRHPPVPNSWVTLPIWTCWFSLARLDYYRGSFLWKPKLPSSLLSFPLKIHKVITISWASWDKPTSFFAQTQRPFASDCGHGAWICLMPPQPSIQGVALDDWLGCTQGDPNDDWHAVFKRELPNIRREKDVS